jgi:hypothetical protein
VQSRIDNPARISEDAFRDGLPPGGLPEKYGVVTAYNPNGQPATEAENVEADSRLKQRLNALGLQHSE